MKKISITLAAIALSLSQVHAYLAPISIDDNAPTLYQMGMPSSDANLEATLGIPPGMAAPALKRFCMIVKNNNRPSQEDYQNLINEYKAFMVKYQGLWQMYNQMLQVGNHPAVMQLVASMARLTPMKSYYEMFINQYQIDQYIIQ